jgi:hypothetical protein
MQGDGCLATLYLLTNSVTNQNATLIFLLKLYKTLKIFYI